MADFSDILKKEPNNHDLLQLLSDISENWREIGEAINVSLDFLLSLKLSNKENYYNLVEVIEQWMLFRPSPFTWEQVISVVQGPIVNNKRKAKEILEYLGIYTAAALVLTQDPVPVDILKRPPNDRDLFQRLMDIDNQWEHIGKSLKISQNDLDRLRLSSLSDSGKLSEVFDIWKATGEPHQVNWEAVIAAIEGPIVNNKKKADEIRQYLNFNKCMLLGNYPSSQDAKPYEDDKPERNSVTQSGQQNLSGATVDHGIMQQGGQTKNRELLHTAMKEGYVTAKWTKFSVSGAPGTGKSSFLKLLYNEDPPIHHDSTPAVKVCEPRKVNITPAIKGENYSNWIKIEHQSLLEMIAQGINDGIRHLKSASMENKPTLIGLEDKPLDQAHDESYQLTNSNDPEQIPSAVTKQKENTFNSVTSQKILGLLPAQRKSEQLYQSHWIYGVDTGGQAAFIDIAPALLHYSSVNIITHNLTENLNDKALFYFSVIGKKVCQPEDRQITNLQLIEASFRSLSSVDSPKLPHIHIKSIQKPHGIVLGTFFDKIVEEGQFFHDKNELLFSTLKKFDEVLLMHRNVGEEVIFPINTMARGNRELKMAKKLRDKICQFFIEAEIPIRWFLFQLELDQHQKSYQSSIVSTTTCFEIGKSLQMSHDDVAAALQYYHDLTIFLYFPKVLPKVVFLHPQLLFDKLSELISISFADAVDHLDDEGIFLPTGSYKELKEEGTFKEDLLTSPNSHLSHGFHPNFMPKDFLNLMTTLFIMAALPKEGKYFMPTVLPTTPFTEYKSVPPQFKQYTDPLILSWNMKPLPRGIFPALVVNLLHCNHSPKFLLTDPLCSIPRYRNAITLHTDYGDILLVDGIYWMAMYSTDPLQRCSALREAAQTGISEVVDSFCYMANVKNFDEYFYCKICSNKTFEHFCRLNDDRKTITCCDNLTTACINECCQLPWFSVEGKKQKRLRLEEPYYCQSDYDDDDIPLSKRTSHYISPDSDLESYDISSNIISLDQLLNQQPLTLEITTYAKTAEWNQLGVKLQLNSVSLAGCRDCTSMYQLWIMEKAGKATRKSLLDALKAIGQNDIARKYEEYLQTKVEKYESAHK